MAAIGKHVGVRVLGGGMGRRRRHFGKRIGPRIVFTGPMGYYQIDCRRTLEEENRALIGQYVSPSSLPVKQLFSHRRPLWISWAINDHASHRTEIIFAQQLFITSVSSTMGQTTSQSNRPNTEETIR
jgi:hypothetical protein